MSNLNSKINTAIVLAGGAGNRLKPLTNHTPKAMIKIGGKPLLQWIVEWLKKNEVTNIVIGVAYLKRKIMDYFGDGTDFGVNIKYSVHTVEGGTCQGFRLAIQRHIKEQNFFALNGDQITNLELSKVAAFHLSEKPTATIVVTNPICKYGRVVMKHHKITSFEEKIPCQMLCNAGNYIFNSKILECIPPKGDIEKITFPLLAHINEIRGYIYSGLFITIDNQKELILAEKKLHELKQKNVSSDTEQLGTHSLTEILTKKTRESIRLQKLLEKHKRFER